MNIEQRLQRIAKELFARQPDARRYGSISLAVMFGPPPRFAPLGPRQRACALIEARKRAGPHGEVRVVEWGPRWEAAREMLIAAASEPDETEDTEQA